MILKKKHRILFVILGILVAVTAMLSLALVIYHALAFSSAPKLLIDILTVMNFVIPSVCIMLMIAFARKRSSNV